jgi:hypothetical protein
MVIASDLCEAISSLAKLAKYAKFFSLAESAENAELVVITSGLCEAMTDVVS